MSAGAGRTSDVAAITGGASGFGLALGGRCAARGMSVVLLDRDGARAEHEAAALATAHGVATLGLAADVADARAVGEAASALAASWPPRLATACGSRPSSRRASPGSGGRIR